MAPRDKVSAAQKSFLEGWVDAYLEGKKAGRLDMVWVKLFHDWFQKWPVVENANLADVEERRKLHGELIEGWKKYIKRWFHNHAIPRARGLPIYDFVEKYLKLHATKGKRAPQLLQFYCKKKFATHIQPIVADKIAKLPSKPTSGEHLKIVREATTLCYEQEGDEEKKSIQAEFEKAKADLEQVMNTAPTPSSYTEAIKDLPSHFEGFAQLLGAITGWKFTLLAGGPDPRNGGRINTIAVHYGENHAGATWGAAMPTFRESVAAPFSAFLNSVYSPSDCVSRAFTPSQRSVPPSVPDTTEAVQGAPVIPTPVIPAVGQIFPPNVGITPSTIPLGSDPLLSFVDELNAPLPSDFIDPTGSEFFNIDFTVFGNDEGGFTGADLPINPLIPAVVAEPVEMSTIAADPATTPTINAATTVDSIGAAVTANQVITPIIALAVAADPVIEPIVPVAENLVATPAATPTVVNDLVVVPSMSPAVPDKPVVTPPLMDLPIHTGKRTRDNPDASLIVSGKRVRRTQTRKEVEPATARGKEN